MRSYSRKFRPAFYKIKEQTYKNCSLTSCTVERVVNEAEIFGFFIYIAHRKRRSPDTDLSLFQIHSQFSVHVHDVELRIIHYLP